MEETKNIVDAGSALLADKGLLKVIVNFLGVFLTALVAGVIAYFAREAPIKTVKLEQLKFISQLTKDQAWKDSSNNFVIEEVFREYFKVFIPIEVIKFICATKSRYYGFVFYSEVRNWIKFEKNKFLAPDSKTTIFISLIIGVWGLAFLHIAGIFFSFGFGLLATLKSGISFLPMLVSFISCLASLAFFYMTFLCSNKALSLVGHMDSFTKEFEEYVEVSTYPVNLGRIIALFIPLILMGGFWGLVWFFW